MGKGSGKGAGDLLAGEGLGLLARVIRAEVCVRWREKHTAATAVSEDEAANSGVALESGGHESSCFENVIGDSCWITGIELQRRRGSAALHVNQEGDRWRPEEPNESRTALVIEGLRGIAKTVLTDEKCSTNVRCLSMVTFG